MEEMEGIEPVTFDHFESDKNDFYTLLSWFEAKFSRNETPMTKRDIELGLGLYNSVPDPIPQNIKERMEYWNNARQQ